MGIFKTQLNGFGALQWNIEDLISSTTFLDLTITIKDQKIHTTIKKTLIIYTYTFHPSQLIWLAASKVYLWANYYKTGTKILHLKILLTSLITSFYASYNEVIYWKILSPSSNLQFQPLTTLSIADKDLMLNTNRMKPSTFTGSFIPGTLTRQRFVRYITKH